MSNELRKLFNEGLFHIPADSTGKTNDLLRAYYAKAGHTDLHTFKEWKEKGYSVRKGEKAILLWARPKATKESQRLAAEAREAGDTEAQAEEYYFPIGYFFSSKQVEIDPRNPVNR